MVYICGQNLLNLGFKVGKFCYVPTFSLSYHGNNYPQPTCVLHLGVTMFKNIKKIGDHSWTDSYINIWSLHRIDINSICKLIKQFFWPKQENLPFHWEKHSLNHYMLYPQVTIDLPINQFRFDSSFLVYMYYTSIFPSLFLFLLRLCQNCVTKLAWMMHLYTKRLRRPGCWV